MTGMITIDYEMLKEAIKRVEERIGVCKELPSVRFSWKSERHLSGIGIQVGNRLPEMGESDMNCGVVIDCLFCDRIGGKSTGAQVEDCKDCLINQVKK